MVPPDSLPFFTLPVAEIPSPKTAHFVMEFISAIFEGQVITEGFGKLSCPKKMLVRLFELKSPHNEFYRCIGGNYLREKVIEGMGLKGYPADA